jgi:hypothetical protein
MISGEVLRTCFPASYAFRFLATSGHFSNAVPHLVILIIIPTDGLGLQ